MIEAVSGATRLFAVLGDPVEQVRAPGLLNPLFRRLGVDAVLVPVHARPDELDVIVRGLQRIGNLDGLLVTVPHKVAARKFADELSPAAQVSGSTNALRRDADGRWYADNFDGAGFVRGLRAANHDPFDTRVALVGAGGAGSAIAVALLEAGARHLAVSDLDTAKLRDLVARLEMRWPGRVTGNTVPELAEVDLAVNATPLGLRPADPLPFPPEALPPGAVVADIVMKPRDTKLLRHAAALGLQPHYGLAMLEHQLELYREFFRLDERSMGEQLQGQIHTG